MGSPSPLSSQFFQQSITVGVGDLAAVNNPNTTLSTYALGSCIGVCLYDPTTRIGGLLHFMLADSSINPQKALSHPAMFADTGMVEFLRVLGTFKVDRHNLKAFIGGGACMLAAKDIFKIGERNAVKIKSILKNLSIPVVIEDVGGDQNRTVHFKLSAGSIDVKTAGVIKTYTLK
jgi:chemotaxis protein CheD